MSLPNKVRRLVRMHEADPGSTPGSKSTVLGVSLAGLARLACVGESTISARASEHAAAATKGVEPTSRTVDVNDWFDLARWVLEHRMIAKLRASGLVLPDAREQSRHAVAEMLAPIRELLR